MRVGVYLGRHGHAGGGMALYASEFVREAVQSLETTEFRNDQLVFYGDSSVFTKELLDEISLSPVLSVVTEASVFGRGAGSYFRPLPNGAAVQLVIRLLPEWTGRQGGYLHDQLFVGLLTRLDRLELLHCTMNFGILTFGGPQAVTVHDLFQAYPPEEELPSGARSAGRKALIRSLYRTLFRWQFKRISQVLCDSQPIAAEVARRFQFDPARISVLPLGLDQTFVHFLEAKYRAEEWVKHQEQLWLLEHRLERGYVLMFASLDPRKNLERTICAWKRAQPNLAGKTLVIVSPNRAVTAACRAQLRAEPDKQRKTPAQGAFAGQEKASSPSESLPEPVYLDTLGRDEMPLLFSCAGVVLLPTLAEGYGLPALEAYAAGSAVVTGKLPHLSDAPPERVCVCDPRDVDSITAAIKLAVESAPSGRDAAKGAAQRGGKLTEKQWERLAGRWPTMKRAVRETLALYRQIILRVPAKRR